MVRGRGRGAVVSPSAGTSGVGHLYPFKERGQTFTRGNTPTRRMTDDANGGPENVRSEIHAFRQQLRAAEALAADYAESAEQGHAAAVHMQQQKDHEARAMGIQLHQAQRLARRAQSEAATAEMVPDRPTAARQEAENFVARSEMLPP